MSAVMVTNDAHSGSELAQQFGVPVNDTLTLISQLRDELNRFPCATPDECWKTVQAIEACLDSDPEHRTKERLLIQHLKSAVSDIIAAHWEGLRVPSGLATLPLSALDGAIRRGR
jgi:hypothetical protein